MSSCRELLAGGTAALALLRRMGLRLGLGLGLGLLVAAPAAAYEGIGRPATPAEVRAWDIDVRPDFKGLPKGAGTVAQGMVVWEAKCASCHGIFGESNEVFSPLVGGTTAKDIVTGRAARLTDPGFPGRTTMMKLSSLSTLWDYIYRAMPWTAPKSLTHDEVYAVSAYLLNLGGVLPDEFTLSDANMAQVQQRLPNRNGMTTDHGLWPGRSLGNGGKPDVKVAACMSNCAVETSVASLLPEHARNNHGNLAEQQRLVGAQRGADTTRPAGAAPVAATASAAATAPTAATAAAPSAAMLDLARKHNCLACHGVANKIVGPALNDVAARYRGRADGAAYLKQRIVGGGSGVWGAIPMPAQTLPAADAELLARWLAGVSVP